MQDIAQAQPRGSWTVKCPGNTNIVELKVSYNLPIAF